MNTAALELHELVTLAELHAAHVLVVHTDIVAAAQSCQSFQSSQAGITKSNIAAQVVQLLTTLADVQGCHVVVLHTVIVAAGQVSP